MNMIAAQLMEYLISDLKEGEEIIEPLADRILGRTILDDFIDKGQKWLRQVLCYLKKKLS